MTYICYRGIEVSPGCSTFLGIEVVVLIVLSIVALVKVYTHNAEVLLADPVTVLVLAGRYGLRHGDRPRSPDHDLHLLGLGHRRGLQ